MKIKGGHQNNTFFKLREKRRRGFTQSIEKLKKEHHVLLYLGVVYISSSSLSIDSFR